RRRRLASGDILVLLDALMYRLGEGLPGRGIPPLAETETETGDVDGPNEKQPPMPPPYEVLSIACQHKVGKLIKRMVKRLELADSSSARQAIVQLAAVLSVVHTLCMMQQRIEWRSKHLKLVDPKHEWELFRDGALALFWGSKALIRHLLQEEVK